MKSPPKQYSDNRARELTEAFIAGTTPAAGNGHAQPAAPAALVTQQAVEPPHS
jgi:hypothetical protein